MLKLELKRLWKLLWNCSIPLARLQGFSQGCHGSVHVLWFKGHACLHHQDAAVAHCVVHALTLPEGDKRSEVKVKQLHASMQSQLEFAVRVSVTHQGFKRARASANLLFRKKSRAVEHSFKAVSRSILGGLNERLANLFRFFYSPTHQVMHKYLGRTAKKPR